MAKNWISEIELSGAKLYSSKLRHFLGGRFTKSESPTIHEDYDQFSSLLIKEIICIICNFQNLLYATYLIKRACTECTVHKVICTSFLHPCSNLDFFWPVDHLIAMPVIDQLEKISKKNSLSQNSQENKTKDFAFLKLPPHLD